MNKYYSLKEAEEYLGGCIKAPTLKKYVQHGLVEHYRIGFMKPKSNCDKRMIVFTAKQLDSLMQRFLIKNNNNEKSILNQIFPKPKPGGKNGTRKN